MKRIMLALLVFALASCDGKAPSEPEVLDSETQTASLMSTQGVTAERAFTIDLICPAGVEGVATVQFTGFDSSGSGVPFSFRVPCDTHGAGYVTPYGWKPDFQFFYFTLTDGLETLTCGNGVFGTYEIGSVVTCFKDGDRGPFYARFSTRWNPAGDRF